MIQKESRLDVADNSGAKVAMVIGTKGVSTARGRFTRVSVGVGDRIVCTVKKALPNADIKAGDKVQAVIVRTKYPSRRADGSYVRFDSNACVIVDPEGNPRGTRIFGAVAREL
jgi:large subunit ribosomal protein L14